jgi:hypothetical protein
VIVHPPGNEVQFDWLELPDPPESWGVGSHAHLLVGALAHSSRWRGVLAESEDFPHLVEALDEVLRKLGGTAKRWRFDRMATVRYPSSGQLAPYPPTGGYGATVPSTHHNDQPALRHHKQTAPAYLTRTTRPKSCASQIDVRPQRPQPRGLVRTTSTTSTTRHHDVCRAARVTRPDQDTHPRTIGIEPRSS